MTIKRKIVLNLILLIGFVSISGVFASWMNHRVYLDISNVIHKNSKLNDLASRLTIKSLNLRRYEKDYFLNYGNKVKQAEYYLKWTGVYEELDSLLEEFETQLKGSSNPNDLERIKKCKNSLDIYRIGFSRVVSGYESNLLKSSGEGNIEISKYKDSIRDFEQITKDISGDYFDQLSTGKNFLLKIVVFAKYFSIFVNFALLILCITVGYFIFKSTVDPLEKISEKVKELSSKQGDLSMRLDENNKDELGILSTYINLFISKIYELIKEIASSTENLSSSSQEISLTMNSFNSEIRKTGSSVNTANQNIFSISDVLEKLNTLNNNQSERIQKLNEKVEVWFENSGRIIDTIHKANRNTDLITSKAVASEKNMQDMNANIEEIHKSSQKMVGILEIIKGISNKVNLLSLNAAIEAARAGESGRGFSVVASEISTLAEQTNRSIKEIESLIQFNRDEILVGITTVDTTIRSMKDILSGIKMVHKDITEIDHILNGQIQSNNEIHSSFKDVLHDSTAIDSGLKTSSNSIKTLTREISSLDSTFDTITNRSGQLDIALEDISKSVIQLSIQMDKFKV